MKNNYPTTSVGDMVFTYDYNKMIEQQSKQGISKIEVNNTKCNSKVKTKKIIRRSK